MPLPCSDRIRERNSAGDSARSRSHRTGGPAGPCCRWPRTRRSPSALNASRRAVIVNVDEHAAEVEQDGVDHGARNYPSALTCQRPKEPGYFRPPQHGPVAQRSEQGTHNPLVAGSNPARPTFGRSISRGDKSTDLAGTSLPIEAWRLCTAPAKLQYGRTAITVTSRSSSRKRAGSPCSRSRT